MASLAIQKPAMTEFSKRAVLFLALAAMLILASMTDANAAKTGTEFKGLYDFIYGAATGYLGRGIAIFAGIAGLAWGASQGKAMPAILGVVLAVFGTLGPAIINSLFKSALI